MAGRTGGRPVKRERASNQPSQASAKRVVTSLAERSSTTDSEGLLTDLIEIWGGPRALAHEIYNEFQAARAGSNERQRYIDLIARIVLTNTTHDIGRLTSPQDLTDSELEDLVHKYMPKVLESVQEVSRDEEDESDGFDPRSRQVG